jgi:hypothetical protein
VLTPTRSVTFEPLFVLGLVHASFIVALTHRDDLGGSF